MKKYLLTGALITITATTLYATTAGSAVVDKMKAAAHSFTLATSLNPTDSGLTSDPVKGKKTGDIFTAGEYNRILELLSEGGSGGGAGWVDVPLADTASFDIGCQYRFRVSGLAGNSVIPGFSQTHWYEGTYKSADAIASAGWYYFRSNNKEVLYGIDSSNNGVWNATQLLGAKVTKIEKLCGGGVAASSSGPSLYKCTNAQSLDATNAPCYGASRNGGSGTNQYRVVSCTDNDGTRSYTMSSILNFGQLVTNKWAVSVNGGTIECDDGTVLVMDILGGGSGGSGTTNTGPGSACGTDGYGIVMYQSTDYNPRKKQCCYIGNGGAVSGGYHDGLVRHLSCSDL